MSLPMNVESDTDLRIRGLETEIASLKDDLAAAIAAQDHLNAQLRTALEKLSELLRQRDAVSAARDSRRSTAEPDKNYGLQMTRLEGRVRSLESRIEKLGGQVTGILESRIWKTLVKGGRFFLKFRR